VALLQVLIWHLPADACRGSANDQHAMKILLIAIALGFASIGLCEDGPVPLTPVKEGLYFLQNMYSSTILELKGGNFRYWFSSDLRSWHEPAYPLSGQYTTNGSTITLQHKAIFQTNWTFMTYRGKPTLWRPSALTYWESKKKVDGYGVLFPSADKPEEIWERKDGTKKSDSPAPAARTKTSPLVAPTPTP
jgi:hypothetical protein